MEPTLSSGGVGFSFDHKTETGFRSEMEEFFTKDKANQGIELPLYTPDGKKTDHLLTILGVDSDAHYQAELREKRKIMALTPTVKSLPESEREAVISKAQRDSELEIFASLILDWTFEEECNHENKIKFLTNAPQIADMIDKVASDRKLFFMSGQSNSKGSR